MDLVQQLAQFRDTHELSSRWIGGQCWEYFATGGGPETVVLLPGGLGTAETSFQYISAFEADYRVLSLSYPPQTKSVANLIEGMAALLRSDGLAQVHLIGGSYSGLLAQCFVRRYPAQAGSLILSHAGVPWPPRIRSFALYAKVLSARSIGPMRMFAKLANHAAFITPGRNSQFWRAYFAQLLNSTSAEAMASLFAVMLDFDRNYTFSATDLAGWRGDMLIVDADSDRFISGAERDALRALYPGARTHRFQGTGHSGPLENAGAYIAVYQDFLRAVIARRPAMATAAS